MSKYSTNSASSALSTLACGFFVVGALGYSTNKHIVMNLSWFYLHGSSSPAYFALRRVYVDGSGSPSSYGSSGCVGSYCEACQDDGRDSFKLVVIAAVFAAASMCVCQALSERVNFPLQFASILTSLVSFGGSLGAIGLFMGNCFNEVDDSSSSDIGWGFGSILTVVGVGLMGLTCLLQCLAILFCR